MRTACHRPLLLAIAVCFHPTVVAADEGAPATESSPDAAVAKTTFDERFTEYKGVLRQIEQLRTEYQAADVATRKKMNADLTGQVAHAQALANAMVEAAMTAFRAAPDTDPRITDLLLVVAEYDTIGLDAGDGTGRVIGGDQFERALPIIKLLTEGSVNKPDLLIWGFLAAFATNDYNLAEEYLAEAKAKHAFDNFKRSEATKQRVLELVESWGTGIDHYRELWAKESALRAAEAAADDLPRVKLTTTKGEITLELFENEAPQSVANFLALVKQKYYDGSPFHRVIPAFMAQGGAKNEYGQGGPDYTIRSESSVPNARHHFRGSLSMAHRPNLPDSGSSQFFLTFVPTGHLDGEHTVFGRVIEGMEVLGDINRREATGDPQKDYSLPKPDQILKAEVLRDRGQDYKFDKLPIK